jgi:putative transferase (TIGR04331 family)
MLSMQIPTIYLEGYKKLQSQVAGLAWPDKPRLIFTSNAYNSDDVFKAWAAEKVEFGAPLVIGQHGGHYGVGRWSFTEDHEYKISDCYLSWGWSDESHPKVKPVGQLKGKRPLGVRHAKQPSALLVTYAMPRYSYWMYSTPVASQWFYYLEDQIRFVESLPKRIQDSLMVRLYPSDYGWGQFNRWRNRFPTLQLDTGGLDINRLIRRSRIYISTYNATTFLESFTMNVPTVIFWNPNYWELRDSAIPFFEELKKVGIFHERPESAASHVAAIWDDVDAWWTSLEVKAVREKFCRHYSNLPDDLLNRLNCALQEVITGARDKNCSFDGKDKENLINFQEQIVSKDYIEDIEILRKKKPTQKI